MDDTRSPAALKQLTLDELDGVAGGDFARGQLAQPLNFQNQAFRLYENPTVTFLRDTLLKMGVLAEQGLFRGPTH
jgi:hypothetical protein